MSARAGKSPRKGVLRIALSGLGLIAAAYGAALYLESFVTDERCCLATWPNANPVQVERLLERRDPRGENPDLQERAARQVITARPVDPSGWMRLAYADTLRQGRLTPQGLKALSTSYTMAAYAARNAAWRVAFALDHWYELDADTRAQAEIELKALSQDPVRRDEGRRRIGAISNPLGRYLGSQHGMLPDPKPPR